MWYGRVRPRIYAILEVVDPDDRVSRLVDRGLMALILANVAAMVLESMEEVRAGRESLFCWVEAISVGVFTVEYVLRLWSCVEASGLQAPLSGRLRFASRPYLAFDLLAILPFYLPLLAIDLRALRLIRIFRIFRILKLARYSAALQTFGRVLRRTKEQLVVTLGFGFVMPLVSASLLHYAEGHIQPEYFGSIPRAMWWGVVTLTAVGYGDAFPVTVFGKLLASFLAVIGIGMFAAPAGILKAAFVAEFETGKAKEGANYRD